ncbi:MAG TPA: hypothetical protein PLJ60_04615 [Chryseolinea sp.]|nr:hypothetical protein [Chryseolinea sp.]
MNSSGNSPGYLLASDEERLAIERTTELLLDSSMYEFRADGMLEYTDLQNLKIVKRVAYWKISGDVLQIIERSRPYQREAKINELNENQLILTPIIDGQVSTGKMVFRRI